MIKTSLSTAIGGAFWTPGATILGGFAKSLSQLIKDLFKSGEQGFAYDINDLSTLFQDAAGTIPVTGAGQPVGLVLDKSKGLVLGGERLTNGDFGAGSTGWAVVGTDATHILTFSNGTMRYQSDTSTPVLSAQQFNTLIVGKWYEVTMSISNYISGALKSDGLGGIVLPSSVGTYKLRAMATSTTFNMLRNTPNVDITIDSISVRELAGNHPYQTTPSLRGILRDAPRRIDYDGVDDKLTVNLPTQLTGCTVIRAVPSVGAQILTNQTIPTPYNDSTDHCGLIVINRALTQTETAQITQIFNRLAGV